MLTCCPEFLFSLSQTRLTVDHFHLIWVSPLQPDTRRSTTLALVFTWGVAVRSLTRRRQCCNAGQTSSCRHFSSSFNLPPLYSFLSSHLFPLTCLSCLFPSHIFLLVFSLLPSRLVYSCITSHLFFCIFSSSILHPICSTSL